MERPCVFSHEFLYDVMIEPLPEFRHDSLMIRQHTIRFLALSTALAAMTSSVVADVRLPGVFTDHMVFQQGIKVPVWGWAKNGERVTIEFGSQRVSTVAIDGKWRVDLKPLVASSTADSLKVTGLNKVTVEDVLVGEVWICSGQSNMQWTVADSLNPEDEAKAAQLLERDSWRSVPRSLRR